MNKKVLLCMLLALSMLLSMASFVSAEEPITFVAEATEWDGNGFDVIISVKNNPGILSFTLSLDFDDLLITPVSVERCGVLTNGTVVSNLDEYKPTITKCLNLGWFSLDGLYDDGEILKVHYEVSKYASSANSGEAIDIVLKERNKDVLDYDRKVLAPEFVSTKVVLPVIEGEGEEFVPEIEDKDETEGDAEGDESVGGGVGSDVAATPKFKIVLVIDSVKMQINANTLINDVAPIIVNDRTMLPIRVIAENLNAKVEWDEANQKVTVLDGKTKIQIIIGSDKAYVNDDVVTLDSPAFIQNDRTYLPVRFVSEALGASVDWDGDLQQVTITK